jgi:hypothetical protein
VYKLFGAQPFLRSDSTAPALGISEKLCATGLSQTHQMLKSIDVELLDP